MIRLNREFYRRDGLTVAKDLLGKVLVHESHEGCVSGVIVETEAYMGPEDRAAHSYAHRGKNGRTAALYKDGGHVYVYLIYGMYYCFNVAANAPGVPECVLVRGVKPLEGIELMLSRGSVGKSRNRKVNDLKHLCDGPGKLCAAFGISMAQYGTDLTAEDAALYIEDRGKSDFAVQISKRMNLGECSEARDYMYRFTLHQ